MTSEPKPLTEPTSEGAPVVVPGVQPVTLRDRLAPLTADDYVYSDI